LPPSRSKWEAVLQAFSILPGCHLFKPRRPLDEYLRDRSHATVDSATLQNNFRETRTVSIRRKLGRYLNVTRESFLQLRNMEHWVNSRRGWKVEFISYFTNFG
jgi:hypothetical protein